MLLYNSYEEDPILFNFDYKKDLLTRATDRTRVYTLKQFVKPKEADEEEDNHESISKKRAEARLAADEARRVAREEQRNELDESQKQASMSLVKGQSADNGEDDDEEAFGRDEDERLDQDNAGFNARNQQMAFGQNF